MKYEFGLESGQVMISDERHYEPEVSLNLKGFLHHMTGY